MTDTELTKAVQAALEKDPCVDLHQFPITVREQQGRVVLEGRVRDIVAKRLAPRLAAEAIGQPGAGRVLDHLQVTAGEERGDGEILDSLYDSLTREGAFRGYAVALRQGERTGPGKSLEDGVTGVVEISVDQGVVRLEGNVESLSHKRLAEVLAWWVRGCVDVDNRLHVVPPERDTDDEITDALRIVLEKDPWLDASQIGIHVRNRIVDLEGLLPSAEQKRMAEYDAWYIPGVHEVINRIEVRP
ncbi:MAG: BON domain-containing protein [Candidatus Competibacteraceae bacterium]|nr:BON domain-containing protein [Candidatus Competibacteraceae bacterium]